MTGKTVFFFLHSLVLVAFIRGQRLPKIAFISGPEVVTSLGEQASLVCKVEDGKEYPINWIKISGSKKENYEYFPLSTGKTLAVRDERFKLSSDTEKSSLSISLEIQNIKEIDDAIYQCQVIVGIGNKITKDVRLRVKTPVTLLSNSTGPLSVLEGESVNLECLASGFPAPKVSWERAEGKLLANGKLKHPGGTLQIPGVHRSDAGKYNCLAENGVGKPKMHEANLQVLFPPSIRVVRPRMHQALHYDVTLQCQVESSPAAVINWRRAGKVLTNDDRHRVTHFSKAETETLSSLKVLGVRLEDYGTYECEAVNKHGQKKEKMELLATNSPIPEAAYGNSSSSRFVSFLLLLCVFLFLTVSSE